MTSCQKPHRDIAFVATNLAGIHGVRRLEGLRQACAELDPAVTIQTQDLGFSYDEFETLLDSYDFNYSAITNTMVSFVAGHASSLIGRGGNGPFEVDGTVVTRGSVKKR